MLAARFALVLSLVSWCVAQDPREELRHQVLRTASRYATFEWKATKANVLHGSDADGVRVDTPDIGFDPAGWLPDGTVNRGMPYSWGGFTSIEEFQSGLKKGLFAGLVPTSERARPSRFALGLDCSGYIARCFDLPVKQTTRSLGRLCYELDGYDALLPGDLLNRFDSHVALFVGWLGPDRSKLSVLEAARLGVKESVYDANAARRDGFQPLRYRPLDPRWRPMDAAALGETKWRREASPSAPEFRGFPKDDSRLDARPLEGAVVGTWVRYSVSEDGNPSSMRTLLATAVGRTVDVQCAETVDGRTLPTGRSTKRDQDIATVLVDLLDCYEPLSIERVIAHDVQVGVYAYGGRRFEARRHALKVEGGTTVRHQRHPMWLDVTAVLSDDVLLTKVIAADYVLAIDWRLTGRRGDASASRTTLRLDSFGATP